jgi:hypothetical protein
LPPLDVPAGSYTTAIDAADSDDDGAIDIVSAARDGLHVASGDGQGRFPRSTTIEDVKNASGVEAADVDGDGETDLLTGAGSALQIIFSPARGGTRRRTIDVGSDVLAVALGAFGGGSVEIVATAPSGLFALTGGPGGSLGPLERYPVGSLARALVLADLDGDGALDCATANFASASISVLRGAARKAPPAFRRGDADGDGTLRLTDAVTVLGRLFLGREPLPCPDAGDADDDGALSLTDAVRILLHLFLGGAPPPAPGPNVCGPDPTLDTLADCSGGCP